MIDSVRVQRPSSSLRKSFVTVVRRLHYRFTLIVLAVAVGAFGLVQSMTIPVLPLIEADLGSDQATTSWVVTGYLLSASVFTPIIGRIGDAVGKERMLVFSLSALSLGSLLAVFAPNIAVMIVARVIQGAGGGVMPVSFGIIRDEFPQARIAGAVGFISALMGAASGLGLVIAGPVVDLLGFDALFWVPFVATGVAAVAAWRFVPESPVRTPGRVPALPAFVFSAALLALLIGVSQGPTWGWTSPAVVGSLSGCVLLLGLWMVVERRAAVPFIDLEMMRRPAVATANLVALLVGSAMFASFAFLPQFLQSPKELGYGFGFTVTGSGAALFPHAVASFFVGILAASMARRWGSKTVVVGGAVSGAVGLFIIVFAHELLLVVITGNVLFGIGIGAVMACLANLVVAGVSPEQTGVASGMNANIRTIGGAIGTAVVTSVVTSTNGADGWPSESGYTAGFAVMGSLMALAAVAALLIPAAKSRRVERDLAQDPSDDHDV